MGERGRELRDADGSDTSEVSPRASRGSTVLKTHFKPLNPRAVKTIIQLFGATKPMANCHWTHRKVTWGHTKRKKKD